jgi:hypothetical protein
MCLLLGDLLFAPPNAQAAARKDERVQKARVECMAGDPQTGVRLLAEVYAETRDPNLIYNQARCFEQNGKNDQAVLRFEEYLRVNRDLSPTEINEVRARIVSLQATSKERPSSAQPEPVPVELPKPTPVAPAGVPAGLTGLEAHASSASSAPPAATPFYKRWWFWTGVGVAVVAGVTTALLLRPQPGAPSPGCDTGAACVP